MPCPPVPALDGAVAMITGRTTDTPSYPLSREDHSWPASRALKNRTSSGHDNDRAGRFGN